MKLNFKKKYHFVFDNGKKSRELKKIFLKKYRNFSPLSSKAIVVLGGDGFMLQTLKKYQRYNKPFYGINTGTFGFLMNKYKNSNLDKIITGSKAVSISPLIMSALNKYGKRFQAIAINEISLLRQSRQTASLNITNNNKVLIKKLICDGVLVCTPAGSTAYNLSVNGPILTLNSKKLAVTPISPFRPRRWKGTIVSSSSIIKIKNLNLVKRSVSAVADNLEVRNIKRIIIRNSNKIKFKLLYDRNNSLTKKIQLEKYRKKK